MSVTRCLAIIIGCSAGFGAAGALLGLALAVGAPAYYRGVFSGSADPRFHPVAVGLGLGLCQGLICGVAVGGVVVLAVALSKRPIDGVQRAAGSPQEPAGSRRRSWMWRIVSSLALIVVIACSGVIGFVAGAIIGQAELYANETELKLAKLRPVLREPRFAGVTAEYSSAAQVYVVGTVDSEQARTALEERLRFVFGDDEAKAMMAHVQITGK